MIQIKNRFTGVVLAERETLRDADLRGANLRGADLCGADLRGADLRGANLCDADLCGADLRGANLRGADLCGADLRGANLCGADLRGANLCDADLCGANLCGANLHDANLRGADLCDADLRGADFAFVPTMQMLDSKILKSIQDGGKLDMQSWHSCETTHCRAGWAIHLCGDAGKVLESIFGSAVAGALIYATSKPNKKIPNFFASDTEAMADIVASAKEETE